MCKDGNKDSKSRRSFQKINQLVSDVSRGRFPQLFSSLLDSRPLMLLSAIDFKARWCDEFDKYNNRIKEFHLLNGALKKVSSYTALLLPLTYLSHALDGDDEPVSRLQHL